MGTIEESVVIVVDDSGTELSPFLPYLLQDLWKLGQIPMQ